MRRPILALLAALVASAIGASGARAAPVFPWEATHSPVSSPALEAPTDGVASPVAGHGEDPPAGAASDAAPPPRRSPRFHAPRLRNEDLAAQVRADPSRVLRVPGPVAEHVTFAVDTRLFYRRASDSLAAPPYYHGGYWLTPLLEVRPAGRELALNLKLVAYNPAASYGVAATSALHSFVGANYRVDGGSDCPWKLDARFFDLDRQDLAGGLLLEQKEMAGLQIRTSWGEELALRALVNGTSGLSTLGTLNDVELTAWGGRAGVHVFSLVPGDPVYFGAVTRWRAGDAAGSSLTAVGELTRRQGNSGALVKLGAGRGDPETLAGLLPGGFSVRATYRGRYLGAGFADAFAGRVAPDYLTIEHGELPYDQAANFLVSGGSGVSHGLELETAWHYDDAWSLFADGEGVAWRYFSTVSPTQARRVDRYFFRAGVEYCPRAVGRLCAQAYVSNRLENAVGQLDSSVTVASPTLSAVDFGAVEARFRF